MAGAQAQDRLARAQDTAHHIDLKHARQTRRAHGIHARGHIDHASVVDQSPPARAGRKHAARLQVGIDLCKAAFDLRRIAHIEGIGLNMRPGASQFIDQTEGRILRVLVGESHGPALRRFRNFS